MVGQPSPRILCFEKRSAFLAFLQPFIAHLPNWSKTIDGIYIRSPYRILTFCTEEVPCRVLDPDKTIRTLFCHYFMMEMSPDNPPSAWLQRGISRSLASDPDDRARLNRKMLASLSRGTACAADLFKFNDKELVKLLKHWSDHRNFDRYEQFSAQSWSVFDYLAGTHAPAARQAQFLAVLNDKQSKVPPEDVFKQHFGFGFNQLIQHWREWVHKQGIGTFAPLPDLTQDKLLHHVIPLIEDRQAKREDRILAIRNLGIEGYILGANDLIVLLQSDDAIPKEEVVWALEAISGMAYGDDKDRWADWWSSLPAEIRDGLRRLGQETGAPPVAPERFSFTTADKHGG
jgi:hypothetical protein